MGAGFVILILIIIGGVVYGVYDRCFRKKPITRAQAKDWDAPYF